ncbi:MAG TPA: ankyrin repeat domain-containing protein [Bryobacteraceae bacterium]|nr:ankyrin repeat domain-containing protein [Bryobacteraceae bacterium]
MRRIAILASALAAILPAATPDVRVADAAMNGDRAAVRSLLADKAPVSEAQGDGMTALHWAAFRDDLDLTKLLVAAGADVRAATRDGNITPLILACTNGDAAIIGELLKAGADPNASNLNGTTALMTAAASGSVDAVKVLLDHGADVKAKENAHGQTALMFAAALDRTAVVKLLIDHGSEIDAVTPAKTVERVRFDQDGNIVNTPAGGGRGARGGRGGGRGALSAQEADKADEAADAAAAADAHKKALETTQGELDALSHALGFQAAEMRLAKPRAAAGDVAARAPRRVGPEFTGGMTALLYAAREGHMDSVRALVEGGANLNVQSGDKFTPLLEAITNAHFDVAMYLIDHGANPNLAAVSGMTPLFAVVDSQWAPHVWFPQPATDQEKTSYLQLMKALLDKGANVNAVTSERIWFRSFTNDYTWVDTSGATAFWRAAQSSDTNAMKLLVEHGADPKLATKAGDTPLHAAAGIGWAANWSVNAPLPLVDAVKYCVELGNDVNAVDNRGYTPLHGAAYLGNNDMVNYLVSKGAKVDARSKTGDSPADMANGPTRFGQPHPDTLALLEKLGSHNSHNCRSDQCVVEAGKSIYSGLVFDLTPAQLAEKANMDLLATSLGFKESEYLPDVPPVGRGGRGGK